MPEINLLQNRIKDTTNSWQGQFKLALGILLVCLVILGAGGAGLLVLTKQTQAQADDVERENAVLQTDLNNQQKDLGAAKQFQAQLSNLRMLLDQHVYMTVLLDEIEKVTYTKAQYITIDASNIGRVHLEGVVSDYTSLAKLILGLNSSDKFSNIKLLSISPSSGSTNRYGFSIDMDVTSSIFVKK